MTKKGTGNVGQDYEGQGRRIVGRWTGSLAEGREWAMSGIGRSGEKSAAGARVRLQMNAKLAEQAALAHGAAAAESRAGFHRSSRRRLCLVAPSRNYAAVRACSWDTCIPEDAPIWEARREGTRAWKVGEEIEEAYHA